MYNHWMGTGDITVSWRRWVLVLNVPVGTNLRECGNQQDREVQNPGL